MKAIKRCIPPYEESFFLLGPRGTGNTTWLKAQYNDAVVIDLLKPDVFRAFQTRPESLADVVKGNAQAHCFVLDGIQKAPELLSVVHSLIEEHLGLQFILTGSSARKIRRTGADLLAGRAVRKTMHPFIASELGEDFSLDDALRYGTIPVVCGTRRKDAALSAYIDLYLREEIQQEGLVRTLAPFTRFLEAASFSHGSQLVSSAIARDCGVGRTTVDGYLKILFDLMIASTLPVFSKRAKRAMAVTAKFYFFDTGVFRTLRPKGPLDRPDEIDGAALEGLVFQHLAAYLDYSSRRESLYCWRTAEGKEVDFVIYDENDFVALEVKNAARLDSRDFAGLKAFQSDYPEARAVLLYRGETQYMHGNVLVVPVAKYLSNLVPGSRSPDVAWRR